MDGLFVMSTDDAARRGDRVDEPVVVVEVRGTSVSIDGRPVASISALVPALQELRPHAKSSLVVFAFDAAAPACTLTRLVALAVADGFSTIEVFV